MSDKELHGNSLKNDKPHHLYQFYDKQEEEVFKYGISSDSTNKDGLSRRIRTQLNLFNLAAGWVRYIVKILIKNIPGREAAEILEDEHIGKFEQEHGRLPRGNQRKNRNN